MIVEVTPLCAIELHKSLPEGMFSLCDLEGDTWLRSVAANPNADVAHIVDSIKKELCNLTRS